MRKLAIVASRRARYLPLAPMPESFRLDDLEDAFGRRYRYLRVSVTDRCDFACEYCMPEGGETAYDRRAELLDFEEIVQLLRVFTRLGIERVRFTGGEPFVRRDFVSLVELVAQAHPDLRLAMTTNGSRLAPSLDTLALAGLKSINISIDSLDEARFAKITRGGKLRAVRRSIEDACARGFEVKLNIVPMRGINEDEWGTLVAYAWSIGAVPRFIELMPLGEGAKVAERRVGNDEVQRALASLLGNTLEAPRAAHGPARYLSGPDGRVGFISPLSDGFCDQCNRLRINARGDIRACLADRDAISLRDVMRNGGDERAVAWAIAGALGNKSAGHGFLDPQISEHQNVGMSLIGG